MGVFGTAPFFDSLNHCFHGPQFSEHSIEVGKDSAIIRGSESHFQSPLTRDSVQDRLKMQGVVGQREKNIELKPGDAPVMYNGKKYEATLGENGLVSVRTFKPTMKEQMGHAFTDPSTMSRLAVAGGAGIMVDASVSTAVGHHAKVEQRKADAKADAQKEAQAQSQTPSPASVQPQTSSQPQSTSSGYDAHGLSSAYNGLA